MFTWKWSWTFSISTPINLAFTSKSPTSSVGEMSNMTFLNLGVERDNESNNTGKMGETNTTFPSRWNRIRTNGNTFGIRFHLSSTEAGLSGGSERKLLTSVDEETHWFVWRPSISRTTPFSCSLAAVYFNDWGFHFLLPRSSDLLSSFMDLREFLNKQQSWIT